MVAEMVRADGIDILVDLSLHMAGNRLAVFAMKPAPVQVSFAGYPAATGVPAIAWRMSDPYLDPPGEERLGEKVWRLPHTFWCYDPLGEDAAPGELPAKRAGHVTFGCFDDCESNSCRVSRRNSHLRTPSLILRSGDWRMANSTSR